MQNAKSADKKYPKKASTEHTQQRRSMIVKVKEIKIIIIIIIIIIHTHNTTQHTR
jgi:hypothetical protein